MADIYDVIKVPDPVLKQEAHIIENIDADVVVQANKMLDTMYAEQGIGLAANQVNMLNRIFVMDLPDDCWEHGVEHDGVIDIVSKTPSEDSESKPMVFINPEVIWQSEQKSIYEEGCLSIPKQYADVVRPAQVRVKFQDMDGTTHEELFDGLHSHCVQHEIDHLNGILFIDYLSNLKRNMILKRVKKQLKEL